MAGIRESRFQDNYSLQTTWRSGLSQLKSRCTYWESFRSIHVEEVLSEVSNKQDLSDDKKKQVAHEEEVEITGQTSVIVSYSELW